MFRLVLTMKGNYTVMPFPTTSSPLQSNWLSSLSTSIRRTSPINPHREIMRSMAITCIMRQKEIEMAVIRHNILSDQGARDKYIDGVKALKIEDSGRTTADFGITGQAQPVSTYD